ncbi:hypothetical protein J6590_051110 [Homalodisca vitripennis]|nr:hypothetical protein J6590_051110 [Homalodisca vitripennis]
MLHIDKRKARTAYGLVYHNQMIRKCELVPGDKINDKSTLRGSSFVRARRSIWSKALRGDVDVIGHYHTISHSQ